MKRSVKSPISINLPVTGDKKASECRVLLFNCNCHTFDVVILQSIRAIHCPRVKAESIAVMAHEIGVVVVYEGLSGDCERVAGVLESIGLRVRVDEIEFV